MPDILTPAQRHRCMSHIRSKATKPDFMTWADLMERKEKNV
ncbi:MAG: hypothetical protein J6T32_02360 [Paludibacteraceae bacterium]|nr:hypothetical protein [Paludibacteraceae bacterium]